MICCCLLSVAFFVIVVLLSAVFALAVLVWQMLEGDERKWIGRKT